MNPLAATMSDAPVECIIKIDGDEISDLYPFVREVSVQMSRSAAATATLVLDTLRDEAGEWKAQDSAIFSPWKRILILAHFGNHHEEILRGYIKEVEADYPEDKSEARVLVRCQDESLLLDRQHQRRVWSTEEEQMSDGQIAETIALEHGLHVENERGLRNASLNQDDTAIKFLQQRAQANGYELFVRAGTLHFRPPQLHGNTQPTIMVHAGPATNCLNFVSRYDGHRPDSVRVIQARSGHNRQSTESESDAEETHYAPSLPTLGRHAADSRDKGLEPFEWILKQPQGATAEEIAMRAQAVANENAWKIVAEGELDGALFGHVLLTHLTVDVDGVGTTHGGRYYVDDVTHTLSHEGYRQKFKLLRNATGQRNAQ